MFVKVKDRFKFITLHQTPADNFTLMSTVCAHQIVILRGDRIECQANLLLVLIKLSVAHWKKSKL